MPGRPRRRAAGRTGRAAVLAPCPQAELWSRAARTGARGPASRPRKRHRTGRTRGRRRARSAARGLGGEPLPTLSASESELQELPRGTWRYPLRMSTKGDKTTAVAAALALTAALTVLSAQSPAT